MVDTWFLLVGILTFGCLLIRFFMYLADAEKNRKQQIELLKQIKDGTENSKS
jgi:preprotein translocase subunit YajC